MKALPLKALETALRKVKKLLKKPSQSRQKLVKKKGKDPFKKPFESI